MTDNKEFVTKTVTVLKTILERVEKLQKMISKIEIRLDTLETDVIPAKSSNINALEILTKIRKKAADK